MAKKELVKVKNEALIPQSIEAEEAVIGAILTSPNSYVKVADMLKPDDFYKPANRLIYDAIGKLTDKNEPVDVVTVAEKLKSMGQLEDAGGQYHIADLELNSVTSANIKYYAQIVQDTAIRRKLIAAGSEIVNMSYDDKDSPDVILDCAQQLIYGVSSQRENTEVKPISSIVYDTYRNIEYRYNHRDELPGVPTGFYDLDAMTAGLQPSNLIILAARPSMGKTALALNIAQNVGLKTDKVVVFFSLEMSESELMKRLLAQESGVDASKLTTGYLQPQDWEKITTAMAAYDNSKIYISEGSALTVSDIRAKCRRLDMKEKIGLIIIDYLQLIQGNNPTDRNQEISAISRNLKALAKEMGVPIIALSQLSRANTNRNDKRPMLSDLRDSGAIEQDADIVMFVHREEYYDKDNPDLKGKAELIIAKNRNGSVDTVHLLYQKNITKFQNATKKEAATIY